MSLGEDPDEDWTSVGEDLGVESFSDGESDGGFQSIELPLPVTEDTAASVHSDVSAPRPLPSSKSATEPETFSNNTIPRVPVRRRVGNYQPQCKTCSSTPRRPRTDVVIFQTLELHKERWQEIRGKVSRLEKLDEHLGMKKSDRSLMDWSPLTSDRMGATVELERLMSMQAAPGVSASTKLTKDEWFILAAQRYEDELKTPCRAVQERSSSEEQRTLATLGRFANSYMLALHWDCRDGDKAEEGAKLDIDAATKSGIYKPDSGFYYKYFAIRKEFIKSQQESAAGT